MATFTKYILSFLALMVFCSLRSNAQIYDGITQSHKYRAWGALSQPTAGGEATFSTYFGYRHDFCQWFNATGLARYNISSKAFLPAIWLNFNIKDRFYFLSRNILDCKAKKYRQSIAATIKLPANIMIDATWDNLYNGRQWVTGDRLQAVGGINISGIRTIVNAGYSFRSDKGFIANARYRFNDNWWVQGKYDGGLECFDISFAFNFN